MKESQVVAVFVVIGLLAVAWVVFRKAEGDTADVGGKGQGSLPIDRDSRDNRVSSQKSAPADGQTPATERDENGPSRGSFEKRQIESAALRQRLIMAIRAARDRREQQDETGPNGEGSDAPGLSGEYIKEVIGEAIPEVKSCYEKALGENPELGGRLVISFTISGEPDIAGLVDEYEVLVESDTVIATDEMMSECMADTILSLEFSPPKQGGTVEVKYPFVFTPAP